MEARIVSVHCTVHLDAALRRASDFRQVDARLSTLRLSAYPSTLTAFPYTQYFRVLRRLAGRLNRWGLLAPVVSVYRIDKTHPKGSLWPCPLVSYGNFTQIG